MNIICFIHSLSAGGAERVLTTLANEWILQGHTVTMVTYDQRNENFYPLKQEIECICLDLSGGSIVKRLSNHCRRIPAFRKVFRRIGPDVIVSFIHRSNVLVLLAASGLQIPVVVSERIDPTRCSPGFPYTQLRPGLYRNASALVVQNRAQASAFAGMCEKIEIIPNPVATYQYQGTERNCTIIGAGRLVPQKNFGLLIAAFAEIAEEFPGWQLSIYGEGPERDAHERDIHRFNLTERISLPGIVPDLPDRLATTSLFVLPTQFEGTPNVMLEAMACGCPVIVSEYGEAVREIITPGINGLLVPVGEKPPLVAALRQLMSDQTLRLSLGKQGQISMQTYKPDTIARKWEKLFEGICYG